MMEKDGRTVAVLKCMTCGQTDFTGGDPKAPLEEQIGELGRHARRNRHAVQYIPGDTHRINGPVDVPPSSLDEVQGVRASYSAFAAPSAASPALPSPSSPSLDYSASWRPAHVPARPHNAAITEPAFPPDPTLLEAVLADGDDD